MRTAAHVNCTWSKFAGKMAVGLTVLTIGFFIFGGLYFKPLSSESHVPTSEESKSEAKDVFTKSKDQSKRTVMDRLDAEECRLDSRQSVMSFAFRQTIEAIRLLTRQVQQLQNELASIKETVGKRPASYPAVKFLNYKDRKRVLVRGRLATAGGEGRVEVTGGTGFVGSHLVDRLMRDGHEVVALDNHFTGRRRNVEHWIGHPNFELVHHDIVNPFFIEVDEVFHLASPASPPHYMYNPVKTIKTNALGTINMLGLARRVKARILLASTSEVYGDPEVHPQPETYWGHVNPVGPRSCYDEGKRVAESLMVAYHKQENVDIRIARIFNTFGPRMHMNDGRVVSNFILQALQDEPMTIYGDGTQTRSFQYVSDLVDGLLALMRSNVTVPVNLGNPEEHQIIEFAAIIKQLTGSKSGIEHGEMPMDDPKQRRPDISRASELLGWQPRVAMRDGLQRTIDFFEKELVHNRLVGHSLAEQPLEHYLAESHMGM